MQACDDEIIISSLLPSSATLNHIVMSRKRQYHDLMANQQKPNSPFMPMFEQFRADLDEHHDRRERIIKASRDITAASKKM